MKLVESKNPSKGNELPAAESCGVIGDDEEEEVKPDISPSLFSCYIYCWNHLLSGKKL